MKKGFGKRIALLGLSLVFSILNVDAAVEDSCSVGILQKTKNGTIQTSSNCDLMMYCVGYQKAQITNTNECRVYEIASSSLVEIQKLGGDKNDPGTLSAKLAAFRGWSEGTILNNGAEINVNALTDNETEGFAKTYYDFAKRLPKNYSLNSMGGSAFNYQLIRYDVLDGRYTAKVSVSTDAPISEIIDIRSSNGHRVENYNCNGNDCVVEISGPIEECEGANPTIIVEYKAPGNYVPGTDPNKKPGDFYFFECPGKQNYIGYTADDDTKGKILPGKKPSGSPGDYFTDEGTVFIPDKECDCGADYSGDFVCDASGSTSEYLKETNNILACVTSGRYKEYCGSSIEKTNDKGKNISTIADKSTSSIVLGDNNKYCSVYCVEDISYDLPGEIKVKNGSYFTLDNSTGNKSVTIKGTRRCYSDKIKTSSYVEDVIALQGQILEKYNEYLKYQELYEEMGGEKTKTSTNKCNSFKCNCTKDSKTKKETCTPSSVSSVDVGVYSKDISYTQIKCEYNSTTGSAECGNIRKSQNVIVEETYNSAGENTVTDKCGTIKTACGTGAGDLDEKWENERKNFSDKAKAALEDAKDYHDEMENLIAEYKSCTNWTNNYCFDPKVEFEYEDGKIYTAVNNQELSSDGPTPGSTTTTYYKNVSKDYSSGEQISYSEEHPNYVYVQSANSFQATAHIDFDINYVKSIVADATETFNKPSVKVCTYHTAGTIRTGDECDDGKNTITLGSDGYVFPVTLQKNESRKYNYNLKFSNIGVSGDDDTCSAKQKGANRLMGCDDPTDVYTVATEKTEAKYKCQYSSCPECDTECVCPEGRTDCYVEDKICKYIECDDCVVSCIGCLWNDGNSTFAYKTISLSDVFPNSANHKDVGYNWNTDPNINPQAQKAEDTLKEIEETKEKAYKKPQYSYTLSPATMGKIRKYNEESNKESASSVKWGNNDISIPKGGYNNDTLICDNGAECKSTFLDGLDKIVGENNRVRNDKWTTKNGTAWK